MSLFDAAVDLNPHQIDAALFALHSPLAKGVLLADEVGLGKTIEAGLVLCQLWAERRRRLLVVCPASIRKQWAFELAEKFSLPSVILDMPAYRQIQRDGNPSPFEQDAVVITSLHFASAMQNDVRAGQWDTVVVDEAHKLRNAHRPGNRMGQRLRWALADRRKVLLTATPLQNSLAELYGLSTILRKLLASRFAHGNFKPIGFARHLYEPLIYAKGSLIEVKPVQLNKGERDFVVALRDHYNSNKAFFADMEFYLLRNQSKGKGIGFFEADNFHPDFILWLLVGKTQYVTFVDPKGLRNLEAWDDPKILFSQKVKEIEQRLGDKAMVLNSFLVSSTAFDEVNWRGDKNRRFRGPPRHVPRGRHRVRATPDRDGTGSEEHLGRSRPTMIPALLHGKLSREQENMEDLLTSSVFGLLSYLPPAAGLLPFLEMAEDDAGEAPLAGRLVPRPAQEVCDLRFWPKWCEVDCPACEPDVVLRLSLADSKRLILAVEAKYLSGKSSEADEATAKPTDQLAREWLNLKAVASREGAEPVLVYLTTGLGRPHGEIRDSLRELSAKRPDDPSSVILWLSWRRLSQLKGDHPILKDVRKLVERLGLTYFSGFGSFGPKLPLPWRFARWFRWHIEPQPINWSFTNE